MNTFTAIDFELATSEYNSACAVGIVTVNKGIITDEYFSLIKPPQNKYMWQTSRVHGIKPKHTLNAPAFTELFPEILHLLADRSIVAHNEQFDRAVLKQMLSYYKLQDDNLNLNEPWECTSKIYQKIGFVRTKLSVCCKLMDIPLNHHDPLSDAKATALLYMKRELAAHVVHTTQNQEEK